MKMKSKPFLSIGIIEGAFHQYKTFVKDYIKNERKSVYEGYHIYVWNYPIFDTETHCSKSRVFKNAA